MRSADVVVIGGGVNGASTAFNLASLGVKRIILVERRHLAAGASGKSGSLVRMHYTNDAEARLAFESLKVFRDFSRIVGGDCGFQPIGFVQVVAPGYEKALHANVAMLRPDHTVHLQKVEVGRDYGDRLEVTGGLQEGDTIIANPGDNGREGVEVDPVRAGEKGK